MVDFRINETLYSERGNLEETPKQKLPTKGWSPGSLDVPKRLLDGIGDVVEVDIDEMSAALEC